MRRTYQSFIFIGLIIANIIAKSNRNRERLTNFVIITSKTPPALKDDPPIMFWRLQKVGSSSIVSLLLSYAFRYNLIPRYQPVHAGNHLCAAISSCFPLDDKWLPPMYPMNTTDNYINATTRVKLVSEYKRKISTVNMGRHFSQNQGLPKSFRMEQEEAYEAQNNWVVLTHEFCPLEGPRIQDNLVCAFTNTHSTRIAPAVRELFIVREPVSRALSVYYFWGELFKLHKIKLSRTASINASHGLLDDDEHNGPQLGGPEVKSVSGTVFHSFIYHGNESSAPSEIIAQSFALRFPFKVGMPGPSWSYSAFASNSEYAVQEIISDRMVTLVMERMDESLVVMAQTLGWSIADIVLTLPRKSLSRHPKESDWPREGIAAIRRRLVEGGEEAVYEAANKKLDERIRRLQEEGVNVTKEVGRLQTLRAATTKICLTDIILNVYRDFLVSKPYLRMTRGNKLRDVDSKYATDGHGVLFNNNLFYSFNVCANCEAHALLAFNQSLSSVSDQSRKWNIDFANCPQRSSFAMHNS